MVLPAPLRRPCPRTMLEIPTSGHTPALLSAIKDEGRGLGLGLRPMPPPKQADWLVSSLAQGRSSGEESRVRTDDSDAPGRITAGGSGVNSEVR